MAPNSKVGPITREKAFDVSDGGRINGVILCFFMKFPLALTMALRSLQEEFSVENLLFLQFMRLGR